MDVAMNLNLRGQRHRRGHDRRLRPCRSRRVARRRGMLSRTENAVDCSPDETNGGRIEVAQRMAGHSNAKSTAYMTGATTRRRSRADWDLTIRALNAWKAIKRTSSTHILLFIPNTKSFRLILITILSGEPFSDRRAARIAGREEQTDMEPLRKSLRIIPSIAAVLAFSGLCQGDTIVYQDLNSVVSVTIDGNPIADGGRVSNLVFSGDSVTFDLLLPTDISFSTIDGYT